jgi:hypothetical protein
VPDRLCASVAQEADGKVLVLEELCEDNGEHDFEGMTAVEKGGVHHKFPPDPFNFAKAGCSLNLLADPLLFVLRSLSVNLGRLERVLRCGPVKSIVADGTRVVLTQIRV